MVSEADIAEIHGLQWYHSIEVSPGVKTPGFEWGPPLWDAIRTQLDKVDFRDKRVLDVASWDGMWAFEAERRGASNVIASDYLAGRFSDSDNGLKTFNLAKRLLNSKVTYRECSVYELSSLGEKFDIVTCFGLLYHCRHPTYALDNIRSCLNDDGVLLLESAVVIDDNGTYVELDNSKIYADGTTWCAHTPNAMNIALDSAYLKPAEYTLLLSQRPEFKIGRGFWRATAFSGFHYHHYLPYPGLESYFSPPPDLDKLVIPGKKPVP